MKRYVMTVAGDEKNLTIQRNNDGFSAFEVIGLHVCEAMRIIRQLEEQPENRADMALSDTKQ